MRRAQCFIADHDTWSFQDLTFLKRLLPHVDPSFKWHADGQPYTLARPNPLPSFFAFVDVLLDVTPSLLTSMLPLGAWQTTDVF